MRKFTPGAPHPSEKKMNVVTTCLPLEHEVHSGQYGIKITTLTQGIDNKTPDTVMGTYLVEGETRENVPPRFQFNLCEGHSLARV